MCQRSGLLQDLLQEALEARREEQESGGTSSKVRCGLSWAANHSAHSKVEQLLRWLLTHHMHHTVARCGSSQLPLQAVQARRGAVSMQDQRHVRALTASERLASNRFQVGKPYDRQVTAWSAG